ncbi:MAG TPA: SpoIIE family protein phosphatase [Terriglobales bacterium]|jgi:sigma-B regulation protein RsbU (phosphoserine phosphatase)
MRLPFRYARARLSAAGLLPTTKLAWAASYLLALDLFFLVLRKVLGLFGTTYGNSLDGWVTFLTFVVVVLLVILSIKWIKVRALWRLRNRLIVTYIFIGVIPAFLLITMSAISAYLFSGQFANFVVTAEFDSQLRSLKAVNSAVANELAQRIKNGEKPVAGSLAGLEENDPLWKDRQSCAWYGSKPLGMCATNAKSESTLTLPPFVPSDFQKIVRDHDALHLRASTTLPVGNEKLTVISSQPLTKGMADKIAANLGEITLYPGGIDLSSGQKTPSRDTAIQADTGKNADGNVDTISISRGENGYEITNSKQRLEPAFTAGTLPPALGFFDREITFGAPLPVVDWATGKENKSGAVLRVQTRPSVLYARLFAALGDFAEGVEFILFGVLIVFGIIEVFALFIGTRLNRTITGAVAQLYDATKHINRGDFRHRIPVKSQDQLAALANSFNSMTASIENLIEEQKEKQRLQNELTIAQEVQKQLFPQQITQLESLEVFGFCRPARTVSGDYYDFLAINSEKLVLAVGDVSGKGISAALLMATIHSAVRAYSQEGIPFLREAVAVGAGSASEMMMVSTLRGAETSPAVLLNLLNHQLYQSTPSEKYATLFLGIYDGSSRQIYFSNGGHLPPIILSNDGAIHRLENGGMVVGLFDDQTYQEGAARLAEGDIFLAYSDGVTEPENDFGEFGEDRLVELVHANRELPLARISEIVTAAVDDWIGAKEQPDDITLVLARARH